MYGHHELVQRNKYRGSGPASLFESLWSIGQDRGDSPGKNTGVGCHALFQEIFSNPGIEPKSLRSTLLGGGLFTTSATWEAHRSIREPYYYL